MSKLEGKVALITGASRGLGRAIALAYAREGASLSICARGARDLEAAGEAARRLGAAVLTVVADVSQEAERERLVSLTLDAFERVDILVNNASALGPTPLPLLVDSDPDAFGEVVRTNLIAPFRLTQAVLGSMLLRRSGVVINLSSDAAVNGYEGWGFYSATKAGLDAMTRVWASELNGTGVAIVSVDPGDMDTDMHRAAVPDADPADLARPVDVAEAFVRLAVEPAPAGRVEAATLLAVAR